MGEALGITALGGSMLTWVGIHDRATEDMFETVGGGAPPYLEWDTDEPNNQGEQDCVSAILGSGLLETNRCNDGYPAVCECDP